MRSSALLQSRRVYLRESVTHERAGEVGEERQDLPRSPFTPRERRVHDERGQIGRPDKVHSLSASERLRHSRIEELRSLTEELRHLDKQDFLPPNNAVSTVEDAATEDDLEVSSSCTESFYSSGEDIHTDQKPDSSDELRIRVEESREKTKRLEGEVGDCACLYQFVSKE